VLDCTEMKGDRGERGAASGGVSCAPRGTDVRTVTTRAVRKWEVVGRGGLTVCLQNCGKWVGGR
jgi:hypothetical protein